MPNVTVETLIARAQTAADMADGDFVNTEEWLRWLNVERQALDVRIAREGLVLREAQETITATGAFEYSISDPLAVLGVYQLKDGYYRRLRHSDLMDGAGYQDLGVTHGDPVMFRITQNTDNEITIRFYPNPTTGTFIVKTIPEETELEIDDEVSYPLGWEERIVLGMARRAVAKEEGDTREFLRQIAEIDSHIETSASDRLFGAHFSVRNVDKVERGWLPFPYIPTREQWLWF